MADSSGSGIEWEAVPWRSKSSFAGRGVSHCRVPESVYAVATNGRVAKSLNLEYRRACSVRGFDRAAPHPSSVCDAVPREGLKRGAGFRFRAWFLFLRPHLSINAP